MAHLAEIAAGTAVELFLVTVALAVLYRVYGWFFAVPKRLIVQAFQRGVVLREGLAERVLHPGAYWITPKRRLILCDIRPTPFQVQGQESLTADGLAVRISLGGDYRVANPASFVTESSDAFAALFLEIRQALRIAAGELHSQDLLAGQPSLTARIKELLAPRAMQLGIEITQLDVYEAIPSGWLRQA
jgi:regulator of protease activity HflC (stomatin/prohibitin superfamily)